MTGRIGLMMAHMAFDLILAALAIIYGDLESTVAHWVFKQRTALAPENVF